MLTEDYIMRMINMAIAALLQAIGLRKAGEYNQALQTIDQALEQLTGLRADLLLRLDDHAFLDSLSIQGELDQERAIMVADLCNEQSEIYLAQNHPEIACLSRVRALTLYLEATPEVQIDPALQEKIDHTALAAQDCHAPFETRFALYSYYENIGNYVKAGQVIKDLSDDRLYHAEMRQEYAEFYQRLLEKSEIELERGGVTRSQVEHALRREGKINSENDIGDTDQKR